MLEEELSNFNKLRKDPKWIRIRRWDFQRMTSIFIISNFLNNIKSKFVHKAAFNIINIFMPNLYKKIVFYNIYKIL